MEIVSVSSQPAPRKAIVRFSGRYLQLIAAKMVNDTASFPEKTLIHLLQQLFYQPGQKDSGKKKTGSWLNKCFTGKHQLISCFGYCGLARTICAHLKPSIRTGRDGWP